jgi:hypothetical protein
MSSSRKNNINAYEKEIRPKIIRDIESQVEKMREDIHTRFDKGITRHRKRLDDCKASLNYTKTRKNASSFTNRLSSFRANISRCQEMIEKIRTLEQKRLAELQELEEDVAEEIEKRVRTQLKELRNVFKRRNFLKYLQSK